MDIADWLKGLGLAQYATAFRENDITEVLLPKLTGEDLKDLGVALGRATAASCSMPSPRSAAASPTAPAARGGDGTAGRGPKPNAGS